MNCEQARARWHEALDDGTSDAAVAEHLTVCPSCRTYVAQVREVLAGLAELRTESESQLAAPDWTVARRTSRAVVQRHRAWRRGLAIAAGLGLALTLYVWTEWSSGPTRRIAELPAGSGTNDGDDAVSSRIGLSVRGESAKRLLAVAAPSTDPNVQVYLLCSRLDVDCDAQEEHR